MSQIMQLKQFGLNDNEAKTYLALLKMGQSSISKLGLEILIPRTTLYYSIKGLKEKGFIFERIKGKKRYFSPRQPNFLTKKALDQLGRAQVVNENVGDLIISLKKITNDLPSYVKVEHYEGKQGVWEVFEKILRSNRDSLWFGFGENCLKYYDFDFFLNNFSKKRRQYGKTKSYSILPASDKFAIVKKREDTDFQEIKFLDKNKESNAGLCVFGDNIAIFSYEENITATIIAGRSISEIVRLMFFMIWDKIE